MTDYNAQFDTAVTVDEFESGGDYDDVPHDVYEVTIDKLELKATQKGKPMISTWFKIADGDQKGRYIFCNQVIEKSLGLHKALDILRALDTDIPLDISNISNDGVLDYNMLAEALGAVKEVCTTEQLSYQLNYSANKKNPEFSEFRIEKVFAAE